MSCVLMKKMNMSELDCRSLGTSQVVDVGKQIQVVDCTKYHYCIAFIE